MEFKVEYKKQLQSRSERVKCVDIDSELPWIVSGLYTGYINIYDYSQQTLLKTLEVCQSPIRCVRFISNKQWIIVGSDDLQLRVYNKNTLEKVFSIQGHEDYIRDIRVINDIVVSTSDDCSLKLWKVKDEQLVLDKQLKEHQHFVMQVTGNPKDSLQIASCSLDCTIKIWNMQFDKSQITLSGHKNGINCVEYFNNEKPYLLSGGDDRLIKIWDYQTKQNIQTIEGHNDNVIFVLCHRTLPIIISGSEDNSIKIYSKQYFNYLQDMQFNMDRPWSIVQKDNMVGLGFDQGTMVLKIGNDRSVIDEYNGKVVYVNNQEVYYLQLKSINQTGLQDSQIISNVSTKLLGNVDMYSNRVQFSHNGHSFSINNGTEYVIYRLTGFKSVQFGKCNHICFNNNNEQLFCINDNNVIKVIKLSSNQQLKQIQVDFQIDNMTGGQFIYIQNQEFIIIYDWHNLEVVQKIDINTQQMILSSDYQLMCLYNTNNEIFTLQLNHDDQEYELQYEVSDSFVNGIYIDTVLFYINNNGKLNYVINNTIFNLQNIDKSFSLLCYQSQHNRIYLNNTENKFISLYYPSLVLEFIKRVQNDELDGIINLVSQIDKKYIDKLGQLLQKLNQTELAYRIVIDQSVKFDLALQLNRIQDAYQISLILNNQYKYQQLGDQALNQGFIDIAINSYQASNDLNSLLLIFQSLGLKSQMEQLGKQAEEQNRFNVAFVCYYMLNQPKKCIDLLKKSNRIQEACIFSRSYVPSDLKQLVSEWKESMKDSHPVSAQIVNDQIDDVVDQLQKEQEWMDSQQIFKQDIPAHQYLQGQEIFQSDINQKDQLIEMIGELCIDHNNPAITEVHEKQEEFYDLEDN